MNTLIAFLLALASTTVVAAQTDDPPPLSLRPFFLAAGERFAAKNSFEAVFGHSVEPFLGGGIQLVDRNGFFIDLTASRFKKTGQRAFRTNNQNFGLGIPLTATITPLEVSGGYRFKLPGSPRLVPYVGVGAGSYGYKETSEFSDASENVDTRHTGYLAVGGVEFRLHRWIGASVDAQYTHVMGILGTGGISQEAGEKDLGGIAARVKVIVGR
jgi:opacity protein-like surface antigen